MDKICKQEGRVDKYDWSTLPFFALYMFLRYSDGDMPIVRWRFDWNIKDYHNLLSVQSP